MAYVYRPRDHRSPMSFPTLGINVTYGDVVDNPALEQVLASNPDFEKVKEPKEHPKRAAREETPADGESAADPAAEQTGAGDQPAGA